MQSEILIFFIPENFPLMFQNPTMIHIVTLVITHYSVKYSINGKHLEILMHYKNIYLNVVGFLSSEQSRRL